MAGAGRRYVLLGLVAVDVAEFTDAGDRPTTPATEERSAFLSGGSGESGRQLSSVLS